MKFYTSILLIVLFSFTAGIYFPWWSIAVVSFIVALFIHQKAIVGFLAGFAAIFLLWGILATWIDMQNQHILSEKIARILPLNGSSYLLILLSAFIGALVSGFGSMTGSLLKSIVKPLD
jgi:cell division protein FtsX